eukprot:1688363-Pleurochrysis_carterae.AAC.1
MTSESVLAMSEAQMERHSCVLPAPLSPMISQTCEEGHHGKVRERGGSSSFQRVQAAESTRGAPRPVADHRQAGHREIRGQLRQHRAHTRPTRTLAHPLCRRRSGSAQSSACTVRTPALRKAAANSGALALTSLLCETAACKSCAIQLTADGLLPSLASCQPSAGDSRCSRHDGGRACAAERRGAVKSTSARIG